MSRHHPLAAALPAGFDTPARIKSYSSLVESQIADWTEPLYTMLRNERNPALYNWGRDVMHSLSLKVIRIATDGNCMVSEHTHTHTHTHTYTSQKLLHLFPHMSWGNAVQYL